MASSAISVFEAATVPFVGQGDLIVFDPITIDADTDFGDFENPRSLGQIVQDSSTWEGEDASTEEIRDEQGNIITVKPIAGTLGYSIDIASTSAAMLKKFMAAVDLDATALGSTGAAWLDSTAGTISAAGFGVDIPVVEIPILWGNDAKTRGLFFPKAKITSNFAYTDGLFRIHATVVAEQVNTTHLKTALVLEGKLKYATA